MYDIFTLNVRILYPIFDRSKRQNSSSKNYYLSHYFISNIFMQFVSIKMDNYIFVIAHLLLTDNIARTI